jgi:glycosyltransferase involved in cell wall biosynthesis
MVNKDSSLEHTHYVLITAARNEKDYIGRCIESVINQTVRPAAWLIVSDGSTDGTDEIVGGWARRHPFIRLLRKELDSRQRGFASKVFALNMGVEALKGEHYAFIGHLDADITLGCDYYEKILSEFDSNSKLGLAGGYIFEKKTEKFETRAANSPWSVAGGIQLFRRKCYEDIGGLKPLPLGGEDWFAEIQARMNGWEVAASPKVPAYHHKPGGGKRGLVREAVREGAMDYAMGAHPVFEAVKCGRRVVQKPYVLFAFIRFYGFVLQYFVGRRRAVGADVMQFLRTEQLARLRKANQRRPLLGVQPGPVIRP